MAGSNGNFSRHVYVYNKTRETFVATEAVVADSYFRRLVGLLGKTKRWAKLGRGLWIIPSRGVHSIGMLFPIDLVFLNKERTVVHLEEHFRPFRVSKVSLKASSVLELPAHTIYRTGTQVGLVNVRRDLFDHSGLPFMRGGILLALSLGFRPIA